MDKLRDETLDEILRKERAYAHELRSIIPELKMLRDIYNGKRPKSEYAEEVFTIQMRQSKIDEDSVDTMVSDIYLMSVGQTVLARHSSSAGTPHSGKRYIVHRVK